MKKTMERISLFELVAHADLDLFQLQPVCQL